MFKAVCTAYDDIGTNLKHHDFTDVFEVELKGILSRIFRQVAANMKRKKSATRLVFLRAPVEHFPPNFKIILEKVYLKLSIYCNSRIGIDLQARRSSNFVIPGLIVSATI